MTDRFADADAAVAQVLSGKKPDLLESEILEFKEDPTLRPVRGKAMRGAQRDTAAAYLIAAEVACLANGEGGTLIIGVADSETGLEAIRGTRLSATWLTERIFGLTKPGVAVDADERIHAGKRLLYLHVPRNASGEPVSAKVSKGGGRRTPRRIGSHCHDMDSLAAQMSWATARGNFDWSASPSGRRIEDIRPDAMEALREFLATSGDPDRIELAGQSDPNLVRQLQLLRTDGLLTRAGALLLTESDAPLLRYIRRMAQGAPADFRNESSGQSLIEQFERIESAIDDHNRSISLPVEGLVQPRVSAIPASAVREVLVNAIMHRDWDRPELIDIEHIGDQLTVYSPGGLLDDLDAEALLMAPSHTRNRRLGDAFRSMRLAEREGTGIDRMYVEMVRLGHPPPVIEERDGGIRVALLGGNPQLEVVSALASMPKRLQSDARVSVAFHILRSRSSLSLSEFANAIRIDETEAESFLNHATGSGVLQRAARRRANGELAWRLSEAMRQHLGITLPYFARPVEQSVSQIVQVAREQGSIANRDVQRILGVKQVQASRLIRRAVDDGLLEPVPGSGPQGRSVRYLARPWTGDLPFDRQSG